MKNNRINIIVYKPVNVVFDFTITPDNTPKWIRHVCVEETNEWPVKIGTVYRNKGKAGSWSKYIVENIKDNELFELADSDSGYHVRCTYTPIDSGTTKMEYYEWVDEGDLKEPFTPEILDELRKAIELL